MPVIRIHQSQSAQCQGGIAAVLPAKMARTIHEQQEDMHPAIAVVAPDDGRIEEVRS